MGEIAFSTSNGLLLLLLWCQWLLHWLLLTWKTSMVSTAGVLMPEFVSGFVQEVFHVC